MCRAVLYLGKPVLLDNLLFQPDSALVRQSYMPKMLHMLNLAGFGMRAWDPASHDAATPFAYASDSLPVFDRNLKNLAAKVAAGCVLAHVRGVAYSTQVEISLQNVHPFQFPGIPLVLAHNGDRDTPEERYYFAEPYRSWHGSPSKQDSEIPLIVAHPQHSAAEIKAWVVPILGEHPLQRKIADLILALRKAPPRDAPAETAHR